MKYLTKTTNVYRLSNEKEAEDFVAELKANPNFELSKYSNEKKYIKKSGEIIDEYIRLTVVLDFNEEKDPDSEINITYERA
jgi:hypothetical protein